MARKKKIPVRDPDEEIVDEARKRFRRCMAWEATARSRYKDDIKFVNADPDNGWQWPMAVRKNRDVDKRPCLTINKTRQFCLNIINDAKQNKPSVKVRPVGDKATFDGSEVMEGIIRHIEYRSNAQVAYDKAGETQVYGGIGYWEVTSDYAGPDTFDQELLINRIPDPLSVAIDPDIKEVDGSDMRFGFIFSDVPKDQFDYEYPEWKGVIGQSDLADDSDWADENHVRVCKYYRRVEKKSKLLAVTDPESGEVSVIKSDQIPKDILKQVMDDPKTQSRDLIDYKVEIYKIAGDQIMERSEWVGSTIPIVRIVGEETVIDNQLDRKGHVRYIKDAQRAYNYWTSAGTEAIALQSKTPYVAAARAIEGFETYWADANTVNHAVLPYNDRDDDGNILPPPQRQQPPVLPQAYIQGMQIADNEMRMVTGQYQEDMGEQSQAISGKAINQRQRQGDLATYHFVDNQAIGIRYTGRILVEAIPKLYDTKRMIKIMGQDGVESEVTIDPSSAQEIQKKQMQDIEKIKIIFNPSFAKYSVEADVGPAYATRRQEAWNAFVQIIGQNPELMKVAGDLMFRAADFPMADQLAERLKRMVPANILGNGPSPEVIALQQQNQNLMAHIQTLMTEYTEERTKRVSTEQQKDIDSYKAESDRMKILLDKFDPQQIAEMSARLVLESMQTNLPIGSVNQGLQDNVSQSQ